LFCCVLRRRAAGERQGDSPEPGRQSAQPFGEVNATNGDFGRRRSLVFDEDLLPAIFLFIETIEPLDLKAFLVLSIVRECVANAQTISDTAPDSDLRDGKASQRGRQGAVRLAAFYQPGIGDKSVGDNLLDQIVAKLRPDLAESDLSGSANGWEHGQERGMAAWLRAGRVLRLVYGDHGTISFAKKRPPLSGAVMFGGNTTAPRRARQ
jgi:hypothetical protein